MKKKTALIMMLIALALTCSFSALAETAVFVNGGDDMRTALALDERLNGRMLTGTLRKTPSLSDPWDCESDYFKITAEKESDLTVTLYATEQKMEICLMDSSENILASGVAYPEKADYSVSVYRRMSAGETVYLFIRSRRCETCNYEFSFDKRETEGPTLLKGGKNMRYATEILPEDCGETRLGRVSPQDDERYFKLTAERETDITLSVWADAFSVDARFLDADENTLQKGIAREDSADRHTEIRQHLLAGETVYIRIDSQYVSKDGYYLFSVCTNDTYEEPTPAWAEEEEPRYAEEEKHGHRPHADIHEAEAYGKHLFSEWETVREATLFSEGLKTRHCLRCGAEEYETVPKKDFSRILEAALER